MRNKTKGRHIAFNVLLPYNTETGDIINHDPTDGTYIHAIFRTVILTRKQAGALLRARTEGEDVIYNAYQD